MPKVIIIFKEQFMLYLEFNSYNEAEAANNKISQNMGLTGDITTNWAIVQETIGGKYIILKPESCFMTDVIDFQEIEII